MGVTTDGRRELEGLIRELSRELGVEFAFLCERCVGEPERARTLVLCCACELLEPRTYDLAGTPCERVHRRGSAYHSHGVREIYPRDESLARWGVEAYLGVAVHGPTGDVLGHLGVMHAAPLADPSTIETRLRALAAQVAPLLVQQPAQTGSAN